MKKYFLALLILLYSTIAFSADLNLSWDTDPSAIGYKVQMSTDLGVTWTEVADTTESPVLITGVPDSGLILFRVSAYNGVAEYIQFSKGAWYNGDWEPLNPPAGIALK